MNKQAVIFDLDGSILNTLEDLHRSVNFALNCSGLPERSLAQVRHDVGNGIRTLILRSVPDGTSDRAIAQVYGDFQRHYKLHCADLTRPYNGIPELLERIRGHGFRTAVVSNKADFAVQLLMERYFPGQFDVVLGEREGIPKKPAPEPVHTVLSLLGVKPQDAVYVGDSEVDVQTAANAGLPCVCVDWGFRSRETLLQAGAQQIVSTPEALWKQLISF